MMKAGKIFSIVLCVLLVVTVYTVGVPFYGNDDEKTVSIIGTSATESASVIGNAAKIRGDFTENKGQITDNTVRYYIKGEGVWFLDDCVVFDIQEPTEVINVLDESNPALQFPDGFDEPVFKKGVIIKLTFDGGNAVNPMGQAPLGYNSNFFYGDDPDNWITGISTYKEIIYRDIYDDIDAVFRNTENGLKYDLIVHPGGVTEDIRIRYEGAESIELGDSGDIIIRTAAGTLTDSKLDIYQEMETGKKLVDGSFKIFDANSYGFELNDDYDTAVDLIIDPLLYSTYVGGKYYDYGYDVEFDSAGNAYVTGYTYSAGFPTTTGAYDVAHNGYFDVFVFKLDATGTSLLYSTFVGGKYYDYGRSIAVDSQGYAHVTGYTYSTDFPTTTGAYDTTHNGGYDVFVFKLTPAGSALKYSTYVGGTLSEYGSGIAVGPYGTAFVTGFTSSTNFPTKSYSYDISHNGGYDVFVFRLNLAGSLLHYSTFVGGSSYDYGYDIAVDRYGYAFVSGFSYSTDFPTTALAYDTTHNGNYDVIVFKLNPYGSILLFSTFAGGTTYDGCNSIAVDSAGNSYVTGFTMSTDFPTTAGAFDTTHNGGYDVFVLKLTATGSALKYSTFIGGSSYDYGYDIAVDSNGNAYLTGFTYSTNFPVTSNAYDTTFNGVSDVFIVKLNAPGSNLQFSTYFGGSNYDYGYGIDLDPNNDVCITGHTYSTNFPTTGGAYDVTINGVFDVFVSKLSFPTEVMRYWVLGQYPRHTWMDLSTFSKSGALIKFWGTTTEGGLKEYLGSVKIPEAGSDYPLPQKISLNLGEFFSESTTNNSWLTDDWYYLELRSDSDFMVVFSRSVILEGSHVTHSDQLLSKPSTEHASDWWFTNDGSLAKDDKILIYSDTPDLTLKFQDRVIGDHFPYSFTSPDDKLLAGEAIKSVTGLQIIDASEIMDKNTGLYSFHSHACSDYAIGVFDRYFHSDDGGPQSTGTGTGTYDSKYYHGWFGLDQQKPRFMDIKDTRIYSEQPSGESWGIYSPDNKLRYESISGVSQDVAYSPHIDDIHRDTVKNSDLVLYSSESSPYYVDVRQLTGGSTFSSDLPAADDVIAHRATYFGYDPVTAKLQIANPYDCDVTVYVTNKQNLRRAVFVVPSHDISVKDLYYDQTFENFFDPLTTASYYPTTTDHAFIIEVAAYVFGNYTPLETNKNQSIAEFFTNQYVKIKLVDVFQKVTNTLMLRQYNRVLLGTYDDQVCIKPTNCTVLTPRITPIDRCFENTVKVTITTATAGATIYYTLDGSEPTTSSSKYTGPFYLNETTTVKAKAFKSGCNPSISTKVTFVKKEKVATPLISPNGGYYNGTINVSIKTGTTNATIYYTTNGSIPDKSSTIYAGPFSINTNTTVKAIAYLYGCWLPSDVAVANFYYRGIKNPSPANY